MSDQTNLEIPKKALVEAGKQESRVLETGAVEQKAEKSSQESSSAEEKSSKEILSSIKSLPASDTTASQSDISLKKVEEILAQGMENVFLSMDARTQEVFKIKGEETAKKINTALQKAKIKFSEIVSLISNWLKIIPQVNRYYLEQEAKIKADAIMRFYNKK
ncbi:MAG: hypothetical protein PHO91_04090 [Patescibacteria group bacterium]|nr:hypothetical protein [Patescibacteria group bacterium]